MSTDLVTVVCWLWAPPPMRSRTTPRYTVDHVNRLHGMVARHLAMPHRFVCITDESAGLDPRITVLPGWPGDESLYRHTRRLRTFSNDVKATLGPRILLLDLDTVILGDLTPIAQLDAPLALWWCPSLRTSSGRVYNPSLALFDAGLLDGMWQAFQADPIGAIARARMRGWRNSDQAILNEWIATQDLPVHPLTEADGLHSFRDEAIHWDELPATARLVGFYDPRYDPAMPELQAAHPWIGENWRA